MMLRQSTKWFTFAMIVMMLVIAVTPVTAAPKDTVRVWVSYQSDKKSGSVPGPRQGQCPSPL